MCCLVEFEGLLLVGRFFDSEKWCDCVVGGNGEGKGSCLDR